MQFLKNHQLLSIFLFIINIQFPEKNTLILTRIVYPLVREINISNDTSFNIQFLSVLPSVVLKIKYNTWPTEGGV